MMSVPLFVAEKNGYRLEIVHDSNPSNPREWDNIGTMVCSHRRYSLGDEQAQNIGLYGSWREWLEREVLEPNGGEDAVVYLPLYLYDHSGLTMNTTGFSCPWDSGQVGWIYATKQRFLDEKGYTEAELFGTDPDRRPDVEERVRLKTDPKRGWAKVLSASKNSVIVDFDYDKAVVYRRPENVVTVALDEVEVMTNRANELLRGEVEIYDNYLRGDVYGFVLSKREECRCCNNIEYEKVDSCYGFYGSDLDGIRYHLDAEFHELLVGVQI